MATSESAAKARTAAAKQDTNKAEVQIPGLSRREFLYYAWAGAMALGLAETSGLIIWFMLPRFRAGEFGGVFTLAPGDVPVLGSGPADNPQGKFWLSHSEEGLVALYKVCTHLGCLYKWVDANFRFECPCHGSKFQLFGRYIEGPAPRSLDRFSMTLDTTNGPLTTNATGDPIDVDVTTIRSIQVDTGNRIKRSGRV